MAGSTDNAAGEQSSVREAFQQLGYPERLLKSAIATLKTVDRAQRWIDALGPLALRSEYLYEIGMSGLQPEDYAQWRVAGLNEWRALSLPRHLATAGLGVDHYSRWKSAGLGSGLESFVPYLKFDLTFDELLSILTNWNREHDSESSNGVGELAEMLRSGLQMDELRRLLASGLSGHQIYRWHKTGIPIADWSKWMGFGFDAEIAAQYSAGGVSAATARDWKNTGLSAPDALTFIDMGFPVTTARDWIGAGIKSGTGALAFIENKVPLDTARVWIEAGLSPEEAVGFIEKGVAPADAAEFDKADIGSSQLTRTESGLEVDLDPWQEDPADQLPSVIKPGSINFTLWTSALGGDQVAYDISFQWDGNRTAEWNEDISTLDSLSPASSSPVWGIASWPDGNDVLLTYTWSELGMQGYDRFPGVAPTSDGAQGATDPRQWIRFGKALLDFILLDLGSGRDEREESSAEYYDPAQDTVMDYHDMFRIFLNDPRSNDVDPDFTGWLRDVVIAGTYQVVDDK